MLTKWLAVVVAAVAIFISVALSVEQNLSVGQPWFLAWGMPVAFIGFVLLIFEVGWGLFIRAREGSVVVHTKLKKELIPAGERIVRSRYIGGVVCVVAALLMESVNVITIMGAQVSIMQTALQTTVTASSGDLSTQKTDLTQDKRDLESTLSALDSEWTATEKRETTALIALYPKIADRVKSVEYETLEQKRQSHTKTRAEQQAKIDAKQAEIEKARTQTLTAKTTESASKQAYVGSVYSFIAQLINPNDPRLHLYVQFWMVTLPSLFLGVIACVATSLAIYTPGRKKETKE